MKTETDEQNRRTKTKVRMKKLIFFLLLSFLVSFLLTHFFISEKRDIILGKDIAPPTQQRQLSEIEKYNDLSSK